MPFNDISTTAGFSDRHRRRSKRYTLSPDGSGAWASGDVAVRLDKANNATSVTLSAPMMAVKTIILRWRGSLARGARILGDAWERGYGDLEWRGIVAERVLPWYALVS